MNNHSGSSATMPTNSPELSPDILDSGTANSTNCLERLLMLFEPQISININKVVQCINSDTKLQPGTTTWYLWCRTAMVRNTSWETSSGQLFMPVHRMDLALVKKRQQNFVADGSLYPSTAKLISAGMISLLKSAKNFTRRVFHIWN